MEKYQIVMTDVLISNPSANIYKVAAEKMYSKIAQYVAANIATNLGLAGLPEDEVIVIIPRPVCIVFEAAEYFKEDNKIPTNAQGVLQWAHFSRSTNYVKLPIYVDHSRRLISGEVIAGITRDIYKVVVCLKKNISNPILMFDLIWGH